MTSAHVCDECKTVAPIGEGVRWWSLTAFAEPFVILTVAEKSEYEFCSWTCLTAFSARMAATIAGGRV